MAGGWGWQVAGRARWLGARFAGRLLLCCTLMLAVACGAAGGEGGVHWEGTIDTLPGGQVVTSNVGAGAWPRGDGWRVIETLRIGSLDGDGPDSFGQVRSVELDAAGRVWVLDGQAMDIRVFDRSGAHVRTIGRRGGGPGEFTEPMRLDLAPDGHIWAMDPGNSRVSRIDSAGVYVEGHAAAGGFVTLPWPGGFDDAGRYYSPVPRTGGGFRMALARYDAGFLPLDTLETPVDPVARPTFTIERGGLTRVAATVPFSGGLVWRASPAGTIWGLLTDEYRLFELTQAGDTLRTVLKAFEPLPVSGADVDSAVAQLAWFTAQGGRVDRSKIPPRKPASTSFFIDDERHLWVAPITPAGEAGRHWDIFEPAGRFLGRLELPFALALSPLPRVRDGVLIGVTRDELDVPYVVTASIEGR